MNSNTSYPSAAAITPSARPSLRGYSSRSRESCETMGRYGIAGSERSDDRDETDNIQSKPIHPKSPSLHRYDLSKRRKSCNSSQESQSRETDEAHLSKSLPTSSYYCSESDERESISQTSQDDNNRSMHRILNRSYSQQPELEPSRSNIPKTQYKTRFTEKPEVKNNGIGWTVPVIVLIFCMALSHFYFLSESKKIIYSDFVTDLNKLRSRYKITDDSLLRVRSGIQTVSRRDYAASFIFLHDSNKKEFNEKVFHDFVNEISSLSANYLRNDSGGVSPTVLQPADLARGPEQLLRRHEGALRASGVLLVRDLAAVPWDRAMAFHYYCDEYSPLVRRSAIFFTLDLAKCDNYNGQKNFHVIVENCLKTLWKSLPQHNMGPLLTRVVNVLVDVTDMF